MKQLKDFVHKMSIIKLSIGTILEIDRSYLFLLASSMVIAMVRPFLDLYLLRNVVHLAFEEKDPTAAVFFYSGHYCPGLAESACHVVQKQPLSVFRPLF